MFTKPKSVIEFILERERSTPEATGALTLLLTHIEYASRIIASHVTKAGLVDILGSTNKTNAYQEDVQKLDAFSNALLVETLSGSGVVSTVASEELPEPVTVDKNGKYDVFFDPIDGSSNIEVNAGIGTIFSIYKTSSSLLQKGATQVAAGYIIYGSSTMFVFTSGESVDGFTLDPGIGSFLLSHPGIKIPEEGSIYSVNEGNYLLWDEPTRSYIDSIKDKNPPFKARYAGSLVADLHRTLLKGGIFLYPADRKHKSGKLRLMYEVNPFSYIMKIAGGMALSENEDPLHISPASLEQTVSFAVGSPENMRDYQRFL